MTDNQTIIDGVDVSKCEYFLNEDGYIPETGEFIDGACEAIAVHDGYGEFMYYGVCKSVNCYFKRAEKEIDENRKLIEKLEEEIACLKSKKDCAFCIDLFEINAKYVKLNSEHETLRVLNNMEKEKRRKEEQALDDIEKAIKHCKKVDICYKCRFAEKCVDETGFSHSFYNLAIDIINKAKEE